MTKFRNRFFGTNFINKTTIELLEERTKIEADFSFGLPVYKFMKKHAETSKMKTFYHMYVSLLSIIFHYIYIKSNLYYI